MRPRLLVSAVVATAAMSVSAGLAGPGAGPAAGAQPGRSGHFTGSGRGGPGPAGGGGRLLVSFRPGAGQPSAARAHGEARAEVRRHLRTIATDVVEVDDVGAALDAYRRRPEVAAVEVDGRVRALSPPADNRYPLQWNLHPPAGANRGSIDWEPVYPAARGAGVLVAVVDTGIRTGGPDGFEALAVRSDIDFDFVDDDEDADDQNGHGTHLAGTIAQRTGNPSALGGPSLAGVAPGAQILPVKVLDAAGEGSVSDTVSGILYAAAKGARVINLSLGGGYSQALCTAVASVAGTALVVAAAGNEAGGGPIPVAYPAACRGAMAVGAVRHDGSRAPYSNAGCEVAATAPGGDLGATRLFADRQDPRNGIVQESFDPASGQFGLFLETGTSMAAAHAAGAAAVLLGLQNDLATVRRALLGSARDLGPPGPDDELGSGVLDLAAAAGALVAGRATPPPDVLGYWMAASDGGIFSFGDAPFLGSTGNLRLNSPIVDMAATATGRGYWLVAGDGGIFSFGDAPFLGSTGNLRLNSPIVGMTSDRLAPGYRLVAADGGIFSFGGAAFLGSTGDRRLNAPVVGMAATPTGAGYWLVASDGGIFSFGDAAFHGSTGAMALNRPIVGMTPTCYGAGYWLVASDGGVFSFGTAGFRGSAGALGLNRPVVAMQLSTDHRSGQG